MARESRKHVNPSQNRVNKHKRVKSNGKLLWRKRGNPSFFTRCIFGEGFTYSAGVVVISERAIYSVLLYCPSSSPFRCVREWEKYFYTNLLQSRLLSNLMVPAHFNESMKLYKTRSYKKFENIQF